MDIMEQLIVFRGIERLLIIIFSGLSLVLGWHLFKIGILSEQKSEIKAGDVFIRLQKVGPGVFFALFGVAVFIYALSSPVNFEFLNHVEPKPGTDKTPHLDGKGSYFSQDQEKYLVLSKSINTIKIIYDTTAPPNISNSDKRLLNAAIANLEKERDLWIATLYGMKLLSLWKEKGDEYLISPENVDQNTRKQFSAIEPWVSGTLRTK
jgi:hypothetical protein